jgi:hypothetical protein
MHSGPCPCFPLLAVTRAAQRALIYHDEGDGEAFSACSCGMTLFLWLPAAAITAAENNDELTTPSPMGGSRKLCSNTRCIFSS